MRKVRLEVAVVLAALSVVVGLFGLFAPGDIQPVPMMLVSVVLVLVAGGVSGIAPNPLWRWSAAIGFAITVVAGIIAISVVDEEGNMPPGIAGAVATGLAWAAQATIVPVLLGAGLYVRDLLGVLRTRTPLSVG